MQSIKLETKLYVQPYQSRLFHIYPESALPYNRPNCGTIELCEVIDLFYNDFVMIPLQVYTTGDSLLYKLVTLIDILKYDSDGLPIVVLNDQNIRTFQMTKDGKAFIPKFDRIDSTSIEIELNNRLDYQLIDITPTTNRILSCSSAKGYSCSSRQLLSSSEKLKQMQTDSTIKFIANQFGFQEKNITILPNQYGDSENLVRFNVLGNIYHTIDWVLYLDETNEKQLK